CYWYYFCCFILFFFFQAEDGIRDGHVTGVQTCALPISVGLHDLRKRMLVVVAAGPISSFMFALLSLVLGYVFAEEVWLNWMTARSEERRVGKECRCRW